MRLSIDFPFLFYRYKGLVRNFLFTLYRQMIALSFDSFDSAVILTIDNTHSGKKKLPLGKENIWVIAVFLISLTVIYDSSK
ncbi:hypothetical protein Mag101_04490 [Microbulbifer agarilyticus]|uniref:Uncharacterized protein n=1 Tax=Microbulbifer agarilyticus TaxID=260552 RepID=A0A1Q2M2Q0_9GAMM|nr:hypothetical protein Mag101_04490 [Microbulbifer agarilyticus]